MGIDTTKENYPQFTNDEVLFMDGKTTGLVQSTESLKMTNREWLHGLSDRKFSDVVSSACKMCINGTYTCNGYCAENIYMWMQAEHKEEK